MAWRGFRYGVRHLMRDREVSNCSIKSGQSVASGDYLAFVLDERRETMTFGGATSGHFVAVDTGSPPIAVNRLVVPSGHNFNGYEIKVQMDSDSGFGSPTDRMDETVASTALLDYSVTATSERYVRVYFVDNFNPEIPELWLTQTLTTTAGTRTRWRDARVYNASSLVIPNGERGDLILGASQRVFEIEYPWVTEAADIAVLDQLVDDVGMSAAFLFDPPFDTESVLICKMARPPERRFVHPVPNAGSGQQAFSYRFSIIEQTV